jgi:hypothetical protein
MAIKLQVQWSPAASSALDTLRTMPERLGPAIARGLDAANQLVLGRITQKRFTGKGPFAVGDHRLGIVTGRLRQSLNARPAELRSGNGSGGGSIVADSGIGSNVKYMGPHEFGYKGDVQVRSFTRHNPRGDIKQPISRMRRGKQKIVYRQLATGISVVKAHTRKMDIPERAPIRTGVEENKAIYGEQLSNAVLEEMKK